MAAEFDILVIGGGVNGLACAAVLAREGLQVCVAERNSWVGGGAVTREITLPGFKHDLYGSSHVWIHCNADFQTMRPELQRYGLKYIEPKEQITGHPDASGGPGIVIYKDIDRTCESIAAYSARDARRYRAVFDEFETIREGFVKGFFSPPAPPSALPGALETSASGLRRLRDFSMSARAWVETYFEHDFVRAALMNWALAPQILPDQGGAGQSFYIMIPAIHHYGQAIPEGGSQMLPNAMARYIEARGGRVFTDCAVQKILVEKGRACAAQTATQGRIDARRALVSALEPRQTFLNLLDASELDEGFLQMVRGYSFGKISICRIHLALKEPPRYLNGAEMSHCAFHRIVDSMAQMNRYYAELTLGVPPSDPFLWSACWTLLDPSRAPAGKHTLICDTFVSNWLASGETWAEVGEEYARRVLLGKLRRYAPNMNEQNILASAVHTGESLEAANPCFVEGTTNGGERIESQLGCFRPFPGYAHYRSPVRDLYMTGPHCHPGGGISAMGTITANVMLDDLGIKPARFWQPEQGG